MHFFTWIPCHRCRKDARRQWYDLLQCAVACAWVVFVFRRHCMWPKIPFQDQQICRFWWSSTWSGHPNLEVQQKDQCLSAQLFCHRRFSRNIEFQSVFLRPAQENYQLDFLQVPSWQALRPFSEVLADVAPHQFANCHSSLSDSTLHPNQWIWMFVLLQELHEEWTGWGQNCFMGSNMLAIFTSQGYIREVFVISQLFEQDRDVFLEVIPLKTKLFWGIHTRNETWLWYWHLKPSIVWAS